MCDRIGVSKHGIGYRYMVAGSIRGMLYEPAVGQENRPSGHSLHSDSPVLFEKLPAKHKYGILVGINIKQTKT